MRAKRIIATMVALTLMGSTVASSEIDWASMDNETIEKEVSNALAELANRGMYMDTEPTAQTEPDKPQKPNTAKNSETRTGKATLMDAEGVKVVASTFEVLNDPYQVYNPALKVTYVVENTSSKNFEAHMDKTSINDWEVDHIGYIDIDAGNKAKGEILLKMEDADVSSLSEIEKVSFVFTYYSEKKNTYVTLKPKNVKFK